MAAAAVFESGHVDMVHDAQFDYYGRRLATCSSDRTIKIFEIVGDNRQHIADLQGHEGPVWQVSWAHPKYGNILASCSFDHRVILWREGPDGQWGQIYRSPPSMHSASINSLSWAPHEVGLMLATGSSDGTISILQHTPEGTWEVTKVAHGTQPPHPIGVTAVAWAPPAAAGSLVSPQAAAEPVARRLVSSGCDQVVKVWKHDGRGWQLEKQLEGHMDWVRDVAWAPNLGLPYSNIASAGQDGQVIVWTEREPGRWDKKVVVPADPRTPVWRVSWSITGGILAVADSANAVTLWKEAVDGVWRRVQQ